MIQLGQHSAPQHTIAHISDTHFLDAGKPLFGSVATETHLGRALERLEASGIRPEALVFTGDLADLGHADAYRRLRAIVEPVAERLGAELIWCMGNHDERLAYSTGLFDDPSEEPQDRVHLIGDLRVIALDSTVPGYHHGAFTVEQLDWLAAELATPAPHGTILALHHPPIPTPLLQAMGMLELDDQAAFAEIVEGSDVRAILAGHLHYSTHSTLSGIPVSVAAATCYTMDLLNPERVLSGVDANQAFNVVHVYEDQLVHSVIPVETGPEVTAFASEHWATIEALTPVQRRDLFSDKNSSFNVSGLPDS